MHALTQIAATLATQKDTQKIAPVAKVVKTVSVAPVKVGKNKVFTPLHPIAFGIHNGSRPVAGKALFALTHAWLSLSGMASGRAYSRTDAIKVAGATCVNYHTGNGNFACNDGMLTLTRKGMEIFGKSRKNDPQIVQAWVDILKTGKPSALVGPKDADHFFRIG